MPIINLVYEALREWKPGANTYIYYPLTSDLVDVMGNGNTGTMNGTCTFDSSTGIHVTGRNGNFVTGMTNGISNRNVFTVNVWGKAFTNQMVLAGYASNYQTTQSFCIYRWDDLEIRCIPQGGNQIDTNGRISADGNWHNYCITANGSKYCTYIDSILLKEHSTTSPVNNVSELQLGWGGLYGSGRSGEGYIKDYIVETVARTAQEVADYYNSTKGNYGL